MYPPTNNLSRKPTYEGHLPQAHHFHGHQQRQSDSQGDRQQLWLQNESGSKESQREKVVPLSDQDGGHCVGCGDPVDEWEAGCQEEGPEEQQTEAPRGGGCEGEDPQGGAKGAGSGCQEDACRGRQSRVSD